MKREQETNNRSTSSPTSSELSTPSSSLDDNDSGKGLLSGMKAGSTKALRPDSPSSPLPSYTKGSGHQTYVDIDSLYAKPICKSDRPSSSSSNPSSEDAYEDVVVRSSPVLVTEVVSDSDGSLYCTPTPVALDRLPTLKKSSTAPDGISRPRFYGRRRRKALRAAQTSHAANARDRSFRSSSSDGKGGNGRVGTYGGGVGGGGKGGGGPGTPGMPAGGGGCERTQTTRKAPSMSSRRRDSESSDTSARLGRRHHRLSFQAALRVSDSEPDLHSSCSDYEHPHWELKRLRQHSLASLSGLAEVTFVPDLENAQAYNDLDPSVTDRSDDTDWETRSAQSI